MKIKINLKKPIDRLSSDIKLTSESGEWMLRLISLEVHNSGFNITKKSLTIEKFEPFDKKEKRFF